MGDIHIYDFYRDVGIALSKLYSVFPRPYTLYVEDLCGPDVPDEFGLHSDRHMSALSALMWLADEGFIKFDSLIQNEAVDQAVLTHKGFRALAAQYKDPDPDPDLPPSIREQRTSSVFQLRHALKERSSIEIEHCVKVILSL